MTKRAWSSSVYHHGEGRWVSAHPRGHSPWNSSFLLHWKKLSLLLVVIFLAQCVDNKWSTQCHTPEDPTAPLFKMYSRIKPGTSPRTWNPPREFPANQAANFALSSSFRARFQGPWLSFWSLASPLPSLPDISVLMQEGIPAFVHESWTKTEFQSWEGF